jgi:hypothetical protein
LQLLVQHHCFCAALRVGHSLHDDEPDYAEQLRVATAGNATRAQIKGPLQKINDAIDAFLIPRLEWRFSHCSGDWRTSRCVLLRVPDKALPSFLELDALQFPVNTKDPKNCRATVKTSGGLVGQATEGDLAVPFEHWVEDIQHSRKQTAYLPVWSEAAKDAVGRTYFRPFCAESEVSPMTNQECFFLPVSSCTMDTAHWGENLVDQTDMAVPFRQTRMEAPLHGLSHADVRIMWQMLFFRQNARTRIEVARREAEWRSENQAWPASAGSTCAAIHVRHGDKLMPFWIKRTTPSMEASIRASMTTWTRRSR